jgi:hypothetical protein
VAKVCPARFPRSRVSAAVNKDDAANQLDVVLHGQQGAKVGGVVYAGAMPPFAATLSDADIANIAEARSSIPVWVWVMCLFVVAWAVWYAARMWNVPQGYADTPTYRTEAARSAK